MEAGAEEVGKKTFSVFLHNCDYSEAKNDIIYGMRAKSPELELALRFDKENPVGAEVVHDEETDKSIGFIGVRSDKKARKQSAGLYVVTAGKVQIKEIRLP